MSRCRPPVNRLLLMRKRSFGGVAFQNVGSGCMKSVGNYISLGAMIPTPALGDGWSQINRNSFEWNVADWSADPFPALRIEGFKVGGTYRVRGDILVIDSQIGADPTARLTQRLGYNTTPDFFNLDVVNNKAGTSFDETGV